MNSNNKKRLLSLIKILRKETNSSHTLSLKQIAQKLEAQGIEIKNRKTLYNDFKILSEYGYIVEYTDGYYLEEAPFTISEIKIITDCINSLKNLDDKFLNKLNNKLYSFISFDEEKVLKKLEYHNKHKDAKFINRLEDALQAINNNCVLIIKRYNNKEDEVVPLFLHRQNDYYYLYYHYIEKKKIYHVRFDNIKDIILTETKATVLVNLDEIKKTISTATNSYYTTSPTLVNFKVINDSEYLRNRLKDDFESYIETKDGFSIKASINNAFFSKLTSYYNDIKISDKKISKEYINFLNSIIIQNKVG